MGLIVGAIAVQFIISGVVHLGKSYLWVRLISW
jgi:small neutral amino acid transporter SnatA (MarC family)